MEQVKEHNTELNALCDQGAALCAAGQYTEAMNVYNDVLLRDTENLRALHGSGVALHKLGSSDEGISRIRKALEIDPYFKGAYNNLGNIYADLRKFDDAIKCYQKLIDLDPCNDTAFRNIALAFMNSARLDEALEACNKALKIKPDQPENYMTIGNVYATRGNAEDSYRNYLRASQLAPKSSNAHTNVIFTMNFIARLNQLDIFRESIRWGMLHSGGKPVRRPYLNSPVTGRRLRIGYVSGDFKLHPVSHHFKPVLDHHDRERFEIFLYSNSGRFDEMTYTLMNNSDHWRNIEALTVDLLADMIRLDGIDILVDLSGHTSLNRLLTFARKPAPIQVTWIGYFNTTGLKSIDYLISDPVTIPPGEDCWFSEQIIRLPDGRFCYEPPVYAPAVAPLPALSNGYITFGSFNKLAKITSETLSLWCAVLKVLPQSRMILKSSAFETESVKDDFINLFFSYGVDASRIEFRKESKHPQMLAEYGDVDISLDTFPFNGGATTCESLWMGVPVVTLSGSTPISRQSASLLASCGLAEILAFESEADYIKAVLALVANLEALSYLRCSLRARIASSPLCNGALFSLNLERAYMDMWQKWCSKQNSNLIFRPHKAISADEYYNAGINRMDEKDYSSAISLFKLAIRKKRDFTEAYNNLGLSLVALGRDYYPQALKSLKKVVRINPDFGEVHNNIGKLLTEMGSYLPAVRSCRRAVELMPHNPEAFLNLGNACRERGLFLESQSAYEIAAEMSPDSAEPLCLLAGLKLASGNAAAAVDYLKKARTLRPDDSAIQSNILFAMNYLSTCSQQEILEESCRWDTVHGGQVSLLNFGNRHRNTGKLRVGYVSADFHRHPVGIFFQAVARNYNQNDFEVYCYCNKRNDDEISREIIKQVDFWRDVEGMTDDDLMELIQRDQIDLLVDLSGHTGGNRLKLFSRRAAPVQLSWLGYFNTTGLANMDYVISDFDTVPLGCDAWYRETVVRMPESRFCFTPASLCPDVEKLPALKNGYVTFGCFNNISKLTPEVVEVWSAILRELPDSRLVLKWKTLDDGSVRNHFRLMFSMYGISKRQIEFRGESPLFVMRDEYNDIDIALDPFPYTGGLTSCEALWMGVPVITLAGERPVSRQTKGFLKVLGLEELASDTCNGYIECAVKLSRNLELLSSLRSGMRERMSASPLCDGVSFTRELENIYRNIWRSWIEGTDRHVGCN